MPIDTMEFLDGIAILVDNHNLRVTVKNSGKGALICGACSFIGGLVAGPVGLAAGGTIGGITAYRMSEGRQPFHTAFGGGGDFSSTPLLFREQL